jgi:hypothetical protein
MDSGQVAAQAPNIRLVGIWVAAILTLMVYSRLIDDNPLSRLAEHMLVGVAAGYAAVLAYYNVLWPRLIQPLWENPLDNLALLIPATLAVLLLVQPIVRLRPLASLPLGLVLGVGAALAIAGALAGSLIPQVQATMLSLDLAQPLKTVINNAVVIAGVIGTVFYFYFTVRPNSAPGRALHGAAAIGKWTMILSFGAVFATTLTARLAVLIGRMQFLLGDWLGLVK